MTKASPNISTLSRENSFDYRADVTGVPHVYRFLYITNIPSFYKINLLNAINSRARIFVLFTGVDRVPRQADFLSEEMSFDHDFLTRRGVFARLWQTSQTIKQVKHKFLVVAGWDQLPYWFALCISPKEKNSLISESTIFESKTTGYRSWVKTALLSRVARAFVPGGPQEDLLRKLDFRGTVIHTGGVGLVKYPVRSPPSDTSKVRRFLYVGRLSPEKNLPPLIKLFCRFPEAILEIVGTGPQELALRALAPRNVRFIGYVKNEHLTAIYRRNQVLVLPSLREPWGLVVEEALRNGLPVIVSDKVGCARDLVRGSGIVFESADPSSMQRAIESIRIPETFQHFLENIRNIDFAQRAERQVAAYLS